jgi:phospholipase/carboxylesterase
MSLPTTRLTFDYDLCCPPPRPVEGFYPAEVAGQRLQPMLTFLPTGYEPNYAYPLLVFFHSQGGNEKQMMKLAPRVSRRNYLALGLRGPVSTLRPDGAVGFGWESGDPDADYDDYVFGAIERVREEYSVHPDRIFLAGVCEGATAAYRMAFRYPEQFAGLAAFNGKLPQHRPIMRLPLVRKLPIFIGHGIANAQIPLTLAQQDRKLLYVAGLEVQFKTYATTHKLHAAMLRDLDRWTMRQVTGYE